MHNCGVGQLHCIALIKRIPIKFIWFFSKFVTNFYEFRKFKGSFGIFKG
jgi:hypothetical protein